MTDAPELAELLPLRGRAVRLDRYGDRDVLYVAEVDVPSPGPDDVLVQVRAAGTNPGEASIRQGTMEDVSPATFPSGQGTDFAGVVVEAGSDVTAFSPGDEVIGWSDDRSSQAEYVTVPADHLVTRPATIPWEVAGSLFVVGVTAGAAVDAVSTEPGQTVVVSSAAGGVGSFVTQLLRLRDVRVVAIASEAHHDWLRSIGAMPVAYGDGLESRIRAAAHDGIDALVDTFGNEYVHLGIALGLAPQKIETIIAFPAAAEVGAQTKGSIDASTADDLQRAVDLVADGRVAIPIARTYPLEAVREAFEFVEGRRTRGKVVLVP